MPQGKPVVRVLDIMCGEAHALVGIQRRQAGRRIEYVGVDMKPGTPVVAPSEKVSITLHPLKLNVRNAAAFRRQLREVADGRPFDEVHWHLPIFFRQKLLPTGERLRAVVSVLRRGGRLYHLFGNNQTPLVAVRLAKLHSNTSFRQNREQLAGFLRPFGLELKHYAQFTGSGHFWKTSTARPARNVAASPWGPHEYSDYVSAADHFIVARKR